MSSAVEEWISPCYFMSTLIFSVAMGHYKTDGSVQLYVVSELDTITHTSALYINNGKIFLTNG